MRSRPPGSKSQTIEDTEEWDPVQYGTTDLPPNYDPPPAEALLLTDEFVEAQINEHLVDEKYNIILLLDVDELDEERLEQAEERRREKEPVRPNLPEKKTKIKRKAIIENNPYEEFLTVGEIKGLVKYVEAGYTADAAELGLDSKFQLEVVNLHLLTKCGLVILKTEGDGNCLLRVVLGGCEFEDFQEGLRYGYHQLRLQFVYHLVTHREQLFDVIANDIKMSYGGHEDVKRYTYKSYLLEMMKDKAWCDLLALKAIASMWAAKITVISADSLFRTHIRHKGLPQDADIVVLFNGHYYMGHYVSCLKTNGENFMIGIPKEGPGYNRQKDRIERKLRGDYDVKKPGEDDLMVIPVSVYAKLVHKAEQYDKMKKIADEEERISGGGGGVPQLPRLDPDDGRRRGTGGSGGDGRGDGGDGGDGGAGGGGAATVSVERDPKDPTTKIKKGGIYEPEKDFGEDEIPDDAVICPRCKSNEKTHSKLLTHIKKFHKDVFNFLCPQCDRGFISKYGWKMHKKFHEKEKIHCEQPNCESEFSTQKSYKQHLRVFHPAGGMKDFICKHPQCGKKFQTKSNVVQHERSCKKTPNRLELLCDICGKGKFYQQNKVLEHKRDIHGWR